MSNNNFAKTRRGQIRPPSDLQTKSSQCRELWGIFEIPNCVEISRIFFEDTEIKRSHDAIKNWFMGVTEDIPASFMDWARTKSKKREERQAKGQAPTAAADPLDIIKENPDCPNGQLCKRLATLIQLQRELFSPDLLMDDNAIIDAEAAMLAAAKLKATRTRAAAHETYEQSAKKKVV